MQLKKIDAAKRQLDATISMFFDDEDRVAIHTVIAAAFTIIRNICE
jgi:hypothetical protein